MDKWTGDYRFYYPSGLLAYRWHYNESGKRDGEQSYFHENGKLKYVGNWANGQADGVVKEYDNKGALLAERLFSVGNLDKVIDHRLGQPTHDNDAEKNESSFFTGTGDHTIYHINGKVEKQGYFENGQLINGKQFIYDKEGHLTSTLYFKGGKLIRTEFGTVK